MLAVQMCLSGCGTDRSQFKISFVSGTATLYDAGFNQNAWEGVLAFANEHQIETESLNSFSADAMRANLKSTENQQSGLVIVMSDEIMQEVSDFADQHRNLSFAVIDSAADQAADNVSLIRFRQEEGAFLAGYLAANLSKTKKVGFIGGEQSEVIRAFEYGFRGGVAYAGKQVNCMTAYVGSFDDALAGKQAAEEMMESGVDVIYHAAGSSGNGVIDAVKNAGKYVIGTDTDQSLLAPHNVVASVLKDTRAAAEWISSAAYEACPKKIGGIESLGLKEGGISMVYNEEALSRAILVKMEELTEKLKAGTITPPTDESSLKAMSK